MWIIFELADYLLNTNFVNIMPNLIIEHYAQLTIYHFSRKNAYFSITILIAAYALKLLKMPIYFGCNLCVKKCRFNSVNNFMGGSERKAPNSFKIKQKNCKHNDKMNLPLTNTNSNFQLGRNASV